MLHGAAWTAERLEMLRKLVAQRATAGTIGLALGGGLSRSAVIGKIHRLKLDWGTGDGHTKRQAKSKAKPKPAPKPTRFAPWVNQAPPAAMAPPPPPLPPEPPAPVPATARHILALREGDCRWVLGDPKQLMFCAAPRVEGSPYCAHHDALAYPNGHGRSRAPEALRRVA